MQINKENLPSQQIISNPESVTISNGSSNVVSNGSSNVFEGGSRKKKENARKNDRRTIEESEEIKQDVGNIFKADNPLSDKHIKEKSKQMQAATNSVSDEKKGFQKKEEEFVEELKKVQNSHIETCKRLMQLSIFFNFIEMVFTFVMMFQFDILVGNNQNYLVSSLYIIKGVHNIWLMMTYHSNIKERQANHPISTLNTFLVIFLYYVSLYGNIANLKKDEDP